MRLSGNIFNKLIFVIRKISLNLNYKINVYTPQSSLKNEKMILKVQGLTVGGGLY